MSSLVNFRQWHGPSDQCENATGEVIEKYKGVLPNALLDEWRDYGWCAYANGNLWLVNPDDYADALQEWLPDWCHGEDLPVVFARGPFGELLVSYQDVVGQLNVHHGRYIEIGADVETFLEFSLDKGYVAEALVASLAKRVRKRIGALASDEMYTFVPALALGGTHSASSAEKVKILPQLSILSQLFDEVSIE